MVEKDYQRKFSRWLQHNYTGNAVFELKVGDTSVAFSQLAEHQEHALIQAAHNKIVFKIPDMGFQCPFDCFHLDHVGAYVVLFFKSVKHKAYIIGIDQWGQHRQFAKRKSITPEDASIMGRTIEIN